MSTCLPLGYTNSSVCFTCGHISCDTMIYHSPMQHWRSMCVSASRALIENIGSGSRMLHNHILHFIVYIGLCEKIWKVIDSSNGSSTSRSSSSCGSSASNGNLLSNCTVHTKRKWCIASRQMSCYSKYRTLSLNDKRKENLMCD